MFTVQNQSTVCPLLWILVAPKLRPMDSQIPRAHGLVSSSQRTPKCDVNMARQKLPVLAYYGTGPFNFTILHNSVNTNSITSVLGLNDGKICTLYSDTSAFFPRRVLPKSHSIPDPNLRCACATAPNPALLYRSVQTRQDLSTTART